MKPMYTTNAQVLVGYLMDSPQYDKLLTAIAANFSYISGKEFGYYRCNDSSNESLTLQFRTDDDDVYYEVTITQGGDYFSLTDIIDRFAEYWGLFELGRERALDRIYELAETNTATLEMSHWQPARMIPYPTDNL